MSARGKARKRALDVLYAADLRDGDILAALRLEAARQSADPTRRTGSLAYASEIAEGVAAHRVEIDELIETYATGWTLERMPAVDRAILRMGVWEILHNDEVPDAVAIAEAVELATDLSTQDSAKFVNGLLARIAQTKG